MRLFYFIFVLAFAILVAEKMHFDLYNSVLAAMPILLLLFILKMFWKYRNINNDPLFQQKKNKKE